MPRGIYGGEADRSVPAIGRDGVRQARNVLERMLRYGGVVMDVYRRRDVHFLVQLCAWQGWVHAGELRGVVAFKREEDVLFVANDCAVEVGRYSFRVHGSWIAT